MRIRESNQIRKKDKIVSIVKKQNTNVKRYEAFRCNSIVSTANSINISSEYNISGIGGYGLNLI